MSQEIFFLFFLLLFILFYRRLVEFNPEKHISVPQFYVMTFYLQFPLFFDLFIL
jgi:hypothetical protein